MVIEPPAKGLPAAATSDPRSPVAFPKLTCEQIKALEPYGKPTHYSKGQIVWNAGDADMCMYVVAKGEMQILDGRTEHYIATHGEGNFSGDTDILSGRPTIVKAVAGTDLETLKVPADCVRSIVAEHPALGEIILRAFLMRRAILLECSKIGPMILGSRYSPDTLRIREFLARNHYPATWEDLETSPNTSRILEDFHLTVDETPVVQLPDGQVLKAPSNADLAMALGITRPIESKLFDLIVIGAGPAGLAAAVYGASEGLSTLVLDSNGPGGQAGTSSRIENYMGFPLGITGQQLADGAVVQAEKFGAQLVLPADVTDITCDHHGGHEVHIPGMEKLLCQCIILAPGATYRKLDVDDLNKYEGLGIYYSATQVERLVCGGKAVAVVGGGNSAGQAAVFMSENAKHVYLVIRGDDLRKTMSAYLARRIERSDKISVLLNSEICGLSGEGILESITIVNRNTGASQVEKVAGVFVMIGASPHTEWLPPQIARDEKGFVLTGQKVVQAGKWEQGRPPFFLETSCPGVFAAGDARSESVKRVASAVGEGSMAVALIHQYLAL